MKKIVKRIWPETLYGRRAFSSWMRCRVDQQKPTDVSEKHTASIFWVEEYAMKATSSKLKIGAVFPPKH
jgi:hypothetical protein